MVQLVKQEEMDEMVVIENLDLVDFQAEMAMRGQMVKWERVFLAQSHLYQVGTKWLPRHHSLRVSPNDSSSCIMS